MKITRLFAAVACLQLASCSTENNDTRAQEQIDSIVSAKTQLIEAGLRHNNDSIISAMAAARADSILGKPVSAATATTVPAK